MTTSALLLPTRRKAVSKLTHTIRRDTRLTPTARLVALELLGHLNWDNLSCFPSLSRIAAIVGRTVRTISSAIRKLNELGYIRWRRRRRRSSSYVFNLELADDPVQVAAQAEPFRDAPYQPAKRVPNHPAKPAFLRAPDLTRWVADTRHCEPDAIPPKMVPSPSLLSSGAFARAARYG